MSKDRAFLNYIRSEGDEQDVIRLCQAARSRGLTLSPLEAMIIWKWYSDWYAAEWYVMDDHGIGKALDQFFATFGQSAE